MEHSQFCQQEQCLRAREVIRICETQHSQAVPSTPSHPRHQPRQDRSKDKCNCCGRYGHWARTCRFKKKFRQQQAGHMLAGNRPEISPVFEQSHTASHSSTTKEKHEWASLHNKIENTFEWLWHSQNPFQPGSSNPQGRSVPKTKLVTKQNPNCSN